MKDYSSYVALIVATETEEKAIKSMYDWKPVTFSDDTQTYYSASIEKSGSSHKIVYARQSEMGMTVAVTLTMKLIEHFRPQFMIMVGIAAGIARSNMAEQIYGDVVVADMIWNYTSGNFVCGIGFKVSEVVGNLAVLIAVISITSAVMASTSLPTTEYINISYHSWLMKYKSGMLATVIATIR